MKQARVVFLPSGKRGTVEPGTTLLTAARTLGVDIDSLCGGNGWTLPGAAGQRSFANMVSTRRRPQQ